MNVADLVEILNKVAPLALSEPWDHGGLQLGNPQGSVRRVAFALDATPWTVKEALKRNCQALVAHHPLFFHSQQDMILTRYVPKVAALALKGDLSIIGWHTAWDSGQGGVNEGLLRRAELTNVAPLCCPSLDEGFGMGGVGQWPSEIPIADAAHNLATAWGLSGYRLLSSCDRSVSKVALCGGAGGDLWLEAEKHGAHLFATSEIKHHQILEALDTGLSLMICDHGEMEELAMDDLSLEVAAAGLETCFLPSEQLPLNRWCHCVENDRHGHLQQR